MWPPCDQIVRLSTMECRLAPDLRQNKWRRFCSNPKTSVGSLCYTLDRSVNSEDALRYDVILVNNEITQSWTTIITTATMGIQVKYILHDDVGNETTRKQG